MAFWPFHLSTWDHKLQRMVTNFGLRGDITERVVSNLCPWCSVTYWRSHACDNGVKFGEPTPCFSCGKMIRLVSGKQDGWTIPVWWEKVEE